METESKPKTRIEVLREELALKREATERAERAQAEVIEIESLDRLIKIEEKRQEAYASGLKADQLLECKFPGLGHCLARTPSDLIYRNFAKASGMLKGELQNDIRNYELLAQNCLLVPTGSEFLEDTRRVNPNALIQLGSALIERMRGTVEASGK